MEINIKSLMLINSGFWETPRLWVGGDSTKFYRRRLHSEVQLLTLLYVFFLYIRTSNFGAKAEFLNFFYLHNTSDFISSDDFEGVHVEVISEQL